MHDHPPMTPAELADWLEGSDHLRGPHPYPSCLTLALPAAGLMLAAMLWWLL